MNKLLGAFILSCFVVISCAERQTQPEYVLRFGGDGTFRIVQFTDLHWNDRSSLCDSTALLIREVLAVEKPDLTVITGDIVTAPPARSSWEKIAALMAQAGVAWTVTLGNHDGESDIGREDIFGLLAEKPFFVGSSAAGLTGHGNHILEIASRDGNSTAALLYMLDSHNKPAAHKLGHYDRIHFDQLEWYRKTCREYTGLNGGSPLPALMFFHIPLQEYAAVVREQEYTGYFGEGIAASGMNSGLFASVVEMQDVMGIFSGHDHDNDYIGEHMDIALAYGRVSGYDACSDLDRGARVIELREGGSGFDTWIRTLRGKESEYFFPSGVTLDEEAAMEYFAATEIDVAGQGVDYVYYEGNGIRLRHTSDIGKATEVRRGTLANISIETASAQDSMAFIFRTWIRIDERGVYNFYTFSDDGSVLYIDGHKVIDNDGGHDPRRCDGKIALEVGHHYLELHYFEDYMGQGLEVGYSSRKVRETVLPDNILFRGKAKKH